MPCRWQITDDTYLRLLTEADATELHALIESNRTYLARWLPWAAGQTFEDTLGFIRRTKSSSAPTTAFRRPSSATTRSSA